MSAGSEIFSSVMAAGPLDDTQAPSPEVETELRIHAERARLVSLGASAVPSWTPPQGVTNRELRSELLRAAGFHPDGKGEVYLATLVEQLERRARR